jgi:hypothetical protein
MKCLLLPPRRPQQEGLVVVDSVDRDAEGGSVSSDGGFADILGCI